MPIPRTGCPRKFGTLLKNDRVDPCNPSQSLSGPKRGGFFFQAEDDIRDKLVTGVQTCALPIWSGPLRVLGHTYRLRAGFAQLPITKVADRGQSQDSHSCDQDFLVAARSAGIFFAQCSKRWGIDSAHHTEPWNGSGI